MCLQLQLLSYAIYGFPLHRQFLLLLLILFIDYAVIHFSHFVNRRLISQDTGHLAF